MDSHGRSIAKAVSWRICAFFLTSLIAWLLTGEIAFAASIGLLDSLVKIVLYYALERAWERLPFGRKAC